MERRRGYPSLVSQRLLGDQRQSGRALKDNLAKGRSANCRRVTPLKKMSHEFYPPQSELHPLFYFWAEDWT
jgi:hypothetical protein